MKHAPFVARNAWLPAPITSAAALAALLLGASCSSREQLRVDTRGSVDVVAVGDDAIALEGELELSLSSGLAETVALDSISFRLDSHGPLSSTTVHLRLMELDVGDGDWPVELSGDPSEVVTRRLRVRAVGENQSEWAHPCQLDMSALSVRVGLIPSESDGRYATSDGELLLEHQLDCPACPGDLEALGFESKWQETASRYMHVPPFELVGDVEGAVWSFVEGPQYLRVLARAGDGSQDAEGWQLEELGIQGMDWHALVAGQEPGVVFAELPVDPSYPDPLDTFEPPLGVLSAMRVTSRLQGTTRWLAELVTHLREGPGQTPVLAAAGGRILVRVESPIGLYVDGVLVDEGSPSGHYLALFDERSGQLVDHAWIEHPIIAARGLADGSFVAVAAATEQPYAVLRIEPDATVSWVHSFPEEIAFAHESTPVPLAVDDAGIAYWFAPSRSIHALDAQGERAWSAKPPLGATALVAAPGGGVLVVGANGTPSRLDAGGALTANGNESGPDWCDSQARALGEGGREPAYLHLGDQEHYVGRMRALE